MISTNDMIHYDLNPYDSFMRRHLQHYGYYKANSKKDDLTTDAGIMPAESADMDSSADSSDSDTDDATEGFDKESALLCLQDSKTREELLRTTQVVYSYEAGRMVAHLREPRQLFGFYTSLYGPQQPARWPAGIQVFLDRIRHISGSPKDPEPLYRPTGMEASPMAVSHEKRGRIVFAYEPLVGSYFMRSVLKSNLSRCTEVGVTLESEEDATLLFESRFESGNLAKAVQVGRYEYELWLRCDLYTDRHTQWYYFRMTNTRTDIVYRFTIVNFMKNDSLYNNGMRPLMYSERQAEEKSIGWFRTGSDIKYYRNNITYTSGKFERSYFSLTWTCQFPHDKDTVYFAHCYPFTYSDLQEYLSDVMNDPVKSRFCRQRLLCHSLAENSVYSVTITSPCDNAQEVKQRKAVVLTARVHPGESNSSWMMKGFLDFLLSDSTEAKLLRDNFLFRIIPMLNPDGVIVGNYRCSLTGRDLNRNYRTPMKELFPCIWHTRAMIKRLMEDREVVLYCDLHGHSRKQNMFIYGCENRTNSQQRFHEQVFPYMLARNAPDVFSFSSSKFHVQKNKEGTGRVVIWAMGVVNSYTLEATFCGSGLGKKKGFHYNTSDYESLGYFFCDTLLDYCDPDNTKVKSILLQLEERMKTEILARLKQLNAASGQDIPRSIDEIDLSKHYLSEIESSDGGSDSSASDGPPVGLQYLGAKKKKKLKSRKERGRRKVPSSAVKDRKPVTANVLNRVNLMQDQMADKKPEAPPKSAKPVKSAQSINGRRQGINGDRLTGDVPRFLQERIEDGNAKRANGHYLEALTEACINEGIRCRNKIPQEMLNFKSTDGLKQKPSAASMAKVTSSQQAPNRNQKFIFPGCRSDRYIYSAAASQLCEAYDINTESIVMDQRPQTAFYSAAAARSGLCFQTHSLKILDRQVLQQRFPGRLKRDRILLEETQRQTPDSQTNQNAGRGDSLSHPWQSSIGELIEKERKFLSSTPSGINRSETGLAQTKLSSTQLTPGWQRSRSIPSSAKPFCCVAGGNTSDVPSEEKPAKQLQDASDVRGSDLLSVGGFSTASKCNVSPTHATALPSFSLTNDLTVSSPVTDDRMTYGDWSTVNPSVMANDGSGLQHKDTSRRLLSATLDFTEMVPRMSKAHDIARFSDLERSKTSVDHFESSVSDPSNNSEVGLQEMLNNQRSKKPVSNPGKVVLTVSRESTQFSSGDGRSWGAALGRPVNPHPPRQTVKKKQS